jgi:group I intron endonuclease
MSIQKGKIPLSSGVYMIKNIINGLVYIGSSNKMRHRRNQHFSCLRANKHSNNKLQNAFNKYGEENFFFSVLEICSENVLIEKEQFWIDFFDACKQNKGYNLEIRADRLIRDEETKRKISTNHKKHWLGKKFSAEHRKKMSENNCKFWENKKFNERHKQKISDSNKRKIMQIDQNGNIINEFFGIKEASEKTGFSEIGIQQVLTKYKRKTIYGFDFQYKE